MNWSAFFLNPAVVWVLIPIAAILIGGIQQLFKQYYRHQERMAMIQQGMIPGEDDGENSDAPSTDATWNQVEAAN